MALPHLKGCVPYRWITIEEPKKEVGCGISIVECIGFNGHARVDMEWGLMGSTHPTGHSPANTAHIMQSKHFVFGPVSIQFINP